MKAIFSQSPGGLGLATVCWLASACSSRVAPEGTRLLSLTPAITETLVHIGAEPLLVGRSDWCNLPPEIARLPSLGSSLTPNLEAIAQLSPSHILVDGSGATRTQELQSLAPVEVFPWLKAEEAAASVRRLGQLAELPEQAEPLAQAYEGLQEPQSSSGMSVLLVIGGDGPPEREVWVFNPGTLHSSALEATGARNLLSEPIEGTPSLSIESLVRLNPATILVLQVAPVDENARAKLITDWSNLSTIEAVARGRIGLVGGPATLSPGPSIFETRAAIEAELRRLGPLAAP